VEVSWKQSTIQKVKGWFRLDIFWLRVVWHFQAVLPVVGPLGATFVVPDLAGLGHVRLSWAGHVRPYSAGECVGEAIIHDLLGSSEEATADAGLMARQDAFHAELLIGGFRHGIWVLGAEA
jgi:hypothetical protein